MICVNGVRRKRGKSVPIIFPKDQVRRTVGRFNIKAVLSKAGLSVPCVPISIHIGAVATISMTIARKPYIRYFQPDAVSCTYLDSLCRDAFGSEIINSLSEPHRLQYVFDVKPIKPHELHFFRILGDSIT